MKRMSLLAAVALLLTATAAQAQIRITEWSYQGADGEYIEITNIGTSPVNLAGWSFDDNSRTAGSFDISSLGVLGAYQSAVIADVSASAFRTAWGLSAAVPVVGGNSNNLGRADEINIYDDGNALVDRLTFDDQSAMGPRTQNKSGNPTSLAALGTNNANLWVLAINGDAYGSHFSTLGDLGNPGTFSLVPEPSTVIMLATGCVLLAGRGCRQWLRRRRLA